MMSPDDSFAESRLPRLLTLGAAISVALAATLNLSIDGWHPHLASVSSEMGFSAFVRLFLTVAGLFAGGIAISLRPNQPLFLMLACLTCILARFGFHPAWDSGRMLAGFGAIVSGLAAILMLMPQSCRRLSVSLLVLLHFGGILTMVTGVPTGNSSLWLGQFACAHVYRPYLEFAYLRASYHYSELGPTDLLWFCIRYRNGETRWQKMPQRPDDMFDPGLLSFHRRLALCFETESAFSIEEVSANARKHREERVEGRAGIRWHPKLSIAEQYRPPAESVRLLLLPSYVRHVAGMHEYHKTNVAIPIISIKVYRVEHRALAPSEMKMTDPFSPDTYRPYFLGEYDTHGIPTHADDDMLGWLIPVYYEKARADVPEWHNPKNNPSDFILYDGLKYHTGSEHLSR